MTKIGRSRRSKTKTPFRPPALKGTMAFGPHDTAAKRRLPHCSVGFSTSRRHAMAWSSLICRTKLRPDFLAECQPLELLVPLRPFGKRFFVTPFHAL
jgi:hypothetical protein